MKGGGRRHLEGSGAHEHLVQQDADGPPVGRTPVARACHDLRRHVFRRAAHTLGLPWSICETALDTAMEKLRIVILGFGSATETGP